MKYYKLVVFLVILLMFSFSGLYVSFGTESEDTSNNAAGNENNPEKTAVDRSVEYKDLKKDHWAYPAVKEMTGRDILSGYPDGTFRPDEKVTREEFAIMLSNAFNLKEEQVDEQLFEDVKVGHRSAREIKAVLPYFPGIDDEFKPEKPAVRENIVSSLVKIKDPESLSGSGMDIEDIFKDAGEISSELREYILYAGATHLVRGYPDGTFRPREELTRAEAAALLNRALKEDEVSLNNLINQGILKPYIKEPDQQYKNIVKELNKEFKTLSNFNISYHAKKIQLDDDKNIVYIFARIDQDKYFNFSKTVFKDNPQKVEVFVKQIAQYASNRITGKDVAVIIGYKAILYYDPKDVYSDEYITRNDEKEWEINRMYAGALAALGEVKETWTAGNNQ